MLVLKELDDLSDAQTAEAVAFDIRWKVACGRSLTQVGFDPSTLVYWRKRIAKSDRPDRVFDAVAEVIAQTGILAGRRRRCVDSTVFDDAVATQDTVTQLMAAIRKVARVVPGAAGVIGRVARLDYSRPGKPPIDWDDPAAKDAVVSDLVHDALAVLAVLAGPDAPRRDRAAADALGLLALVAGQDVEPAEDSDGTDGRWRIARKVAPDRVISTVDRQARHTRKGKSRRRDGFRGHVAAEPETGLITGCEMTMAAGPGSTDAENGVQMAARDRFHGTAEGGEPGPEPQPPAGQPPGAGPADAPQQGTGLEVYGDSSYGSGQARAAYRDAGHDTVIKPGPLRPAVPGGFTIDDFTIDEQAGTVTCPAGITRPMSKTRTVTFGAACAGCRCARGAPPPRTAGRWPSTRMRTCCAPPAPRPARRSSSAPTPPGQPSSGSSPGPPPRTATGSGSATPAPPRTTPGCGPGAPRSTCGPCCGTAWPAVTEHGFWPDRRPGRSRPGSRTAATVTTGRQHWQTTARPAAVPVNGQNSRYRISVVQCRPSSSSWLPDPLSFLCVGGW